MTDLPEISDEMMDAYSRTAERECGSPFCACEGSLRAGLAAALVASGWRPEADVLREAGDAFAAHWRAAAGVGWAAGVPSAVASVVHWLRDRATALEPPLPLPVADGREIEQGQGRSEEQEHG